ncbi:MAG: AMP-binding protein, partial [Candidatus Binatia bacterium]
MDLSDFIARRALRSPQTFVEFAAADIDQSIHQRFERQVQQYGDGCAVRLPSGDVSYAALNAAANRAARLLLATAANVSGPVALMMDQGYQAVVWTLAILKAGLCYAPLDQRLPSAVLNGIIKDLAPGMLVADGKYLELARNLAGRDFPVIQAHAARDGFSGNNVDRLVSADTLAYVFYTSGSTG